MSFKVLKEMVELQEAGIIDTIKAGIADGRARRAAIDKKYDAIEKQNSAQKKAASNAVVDFTRDYLGKFFTQFPFYSQTDDFNKVIKSADDLNSAKAIFSKLADDIDGLTTKLNSALVASGKIKTAQADAYVRQGRKYQFRQPPRQLAQFVRKEADFFKRLITVNDKGELNTGDFVDLLSRKIKATREYRAGDATQALNLLFPYMTAELRDLAEVIGKATPQAAPDASAPKKPAVNDNRKPPTQ